MTPEAILGGQGTKMAARAACVAVCRRLQQVKGWSGNPGGRRRRHRVPLLPSTQPARSVPPELLLGRDKKRADFFFPGDTQIDKIGTRTIECQSGKDEKNMFRSPAFRLERAVRTLSSEKTGILGYLGAEPGLDSESSRGATLRGPPRLQGLKRLTRRAPRNGLDLPQEVL